MCTAGGFNLTKFICNRKNVLMSILDIHRREGVKDTDLVKEELPTERALGVYWNVEKDALGLKVNLKEKPRNQRGMLSMMSSFYDPLGLVSPFILKGRSILQELPRRITLGQTSIGRVCEEMGSLEKRII